MAGAAPPGVASREPLAAVARRHAVLLTAAAAALAWVALVDPSKHTVLWPCPLHAVTGWSCPFCGATRATHELLHGHLGAAVDHNLAYVALLPAAATAALYWLRARRLPALVARPWSVPAMLAVAVAWGVVRNLPVAPLRWLAA